MPDQVSPARCETRCSQWPNCGHDWSAWEAPAARPSWDEYGLAFAATAALRADCTRRKVGAALVKENRIRSTGYNGAPSKGPSCLAGECPRGRMSTSDVAPGSSYDTGAGSCVALHAEQNAILYASREEREGATLYVTHAPCDGCSRLIAGSGILRVVWPDGEASVIEGRLVPFRTDYSVPVRFMSGVPDGSVR